jgi:hypothetical protein
MAANLLTLTTCNLAGETHMTQAGLGENRVTLSRVVCSAQTMAIEPAEMLCRHRYA